MNPIDVSAVPKSELQPPFTSDPNAPRPSMVAVQVPKPKLPRHLESEPTVTMLFPRKMSLNLDNYEGLVHFEKGLNEVPLSLAEGWVGKDRHGNDLPAGPHWYLVQQGVAKYAKPLEPEPDPAELADKLKAAGYEVIPPQPAVEELEDEEEVEDSAPAPDKGRATKSVGKVAKARR